MCGEHPSPCFNRETATTTRRRASPCRTINPVLAFRRFGSSGRQRGAAAAAAAMESAGVRPLCLYWLNNSIGSFTFILLLLLCTAFRFNPRHLHTQLPAGFFARQSTMSQVIPQVIYVVDGRGGLFCMSEVGRCSSAVATFTYTHRFMCC